MIAFVFLHYDDQSLEELHGMYVERNENTNMLRCSVDSCSNVRELRPVQEKPRLRDELRSGAINRETSFLELFTRVMMA